MSHDYLSHFLPTGLSDHFDIVDVKEKSTLDYFGGIMEIYLDEKNVLHRDDHKDFESKGFCPMAKAQDFPIRGRKVYLCIRRRKWRHKQTGKEARNTHKLTADGARMTEELAAFLKDNNRDPRRYH